MAALAIASTPIAGLPFRNPHALEAVRVPEATFAGYSFDASGGRRRETALRRWWPFLLGAAAVTLVAAHAAAQAV